MSSLLPFDFTEILHETLERERREDDKLMHASSHLSGSLRHAQLDIAGAPKEDWPTAHPSSTPGHSHLYFDVEMTWTQPGAATKPHAPPSTYDANSEREALRAAA